MRMELNASAKSASSLVFFVCYNKYLPPWKNLGSTLDDNIFGYFFR